MKPPRLHELTARVVAWHNRHPLAQRIDASQVHSIGEVVLPFVSKRPAAGMPAPAPAAPPDPAPAGAPTLAEALAQRQQRLQPVAAPGAIDGLDVQSVLPADHADLFDPPAPEAVDHAEAPGGASPTASIPAPAGEGDGGDDGETALVIPLLDGDAVDDASAPARDGADPAMRPAAEDAPPPGEDAGPPADASAEPAADPPADPPADSADTPPPDGPPDAATDAATGATTDATTAAATDAPADAPPDAPPGTPADPSTDAPARLVADTDAPATGDTALLSAADALAQDMAQAAGLAPPAGTGPPAEHGMVSAPPPGAVYPPPHGPVPESELARAVARRAAAQQAAGSGAPLHGDLADMPAGSRWQRLLAALRGLLTGRQPGLPPLRAAFSEAFIWPLRPARVARWAQRHGRLQPLAPVDWPQRRIETDRTRLAALRGQGLTHELPLHVLTAAIGVGDRRIRVLVGADGSILGPRAYSRQRLGSAGLVAAVALVGLGWTLRPLHGGPHGAAAAQLAAAAASAASAPAPAASAPPVAAASAAASAAQLADAARAAPPPASATAAEAATAAASAASDGADGSSRLAAAPADAAASQPQADIRPQLSDEERYAARVEAARLRGEPPPDPPPTLLAGPVYAVVGPPSRQRATAAGSLAAMKAAASRLDGAAPEHGELLESQGQWRAAWWPFTSLVDAERARVLLAGKGVKAEVVEF